MDMNEQTCYHIGHCILYGSILGFVWYSTHFWWGWLPTLFRFRKLIKDDRSRANIVEQGYPYIWRMSLNVLSLPTAIGLLLRLIMLLQITWWHASCNQHLRPLESSGLHWGTIYHAWHTLYSRIEVHSRAVSVWKAAPSHGKLMSAISNLERMKA